VLVILVGLAIYRADLHGGSVKLLDWLMQTATTVLGAYIGITQAARVAWKQNGNGGSNGKQPTANGSGSLPTSTVAGN
jgi:hypothetical protein